MADTTIQKRAAEWVRSTFLKSMFGQTFERRACKLNTGGAVEFGAVAEDGKIVGFISTSTPLVPKGSVGRGKLSKARADALFLSMIDGEVERLLIYTDAEMAKLMHGEISAGRLPATIKVLHAQLPESLQAEVSSSRNQASQELMGL